jgi:hypothetical protein
LGLLPDAAFWFLQLAVLLASFLLTVSVAPYRLLRGIVGSAWLPTVALVLGFYYGNDVYHRSSLSLRVLLHPRPVGGILCFIFLTGNTLFQSGLTA